MNRRTVLHATGAAFLAGAAGARGDDEEEKAGPGDLATLLDPILKRRKLPALAGAVVVDGAVKAAGAVGVRAIGSPEKVTAADKFHIGSCTKAMTATLIGLLVGQKKLSWDMPLAAALPNFAKNMHSGYRTATLELLLCNRAGFAGETAPKGKTLSDVRSLPGSTGEQRRAYIKMMLAQEPDAAPNTKFIYSNAGYVTAGLIVENWAKSSWEDAMKKMLFTPLGMTSAGFGWMAKKGKRDQPWPHYGEGSSRKPAPPGPGADNPLSIGPAGSVHCSIADWAKFAALHVGGGKRLLKDKTLEKLHTPIGDQEYAMGWIVVDGEWGGGKVLSHAGSNTMNYAAALLAPKKKFAALAATNAAGSDPTASDGAKACDDVTAALIGKYLGG